MSTRVSSATNLSATYFMRNYYSNNRDAMKSSKRKEYSITDARRMMITTHHCGQEAI